MKQISPFKILEMSEEQHRIDHYKENPIGIIKIIYQVFGKDVLLSDLLKVLRQYRNFSLEELMVTFADVEVSECYGNKLLIFMQAGYSISEIEEVYKLIIDKNPDIARNLCTKKTLNQT